MYFGSIPPISLNDLPVAHAKAAEIPEHASNQFLSSTLYSFEPSNALLNLLSKFILL